MWEAYKLKNNQCHHPFKIPKVCQVLTVAVVYTTSWLATMFLVFHAKPWLLEINYIKYDFM